jgi:hypothetical protein
MMLTAEAWTDAMAVSCKQVAAAALAVAVLL